MSSSAESYRQTYGDRKQSVVDLIERTSDFLKRNNRDVDADGLIKLRDNVQNGLFSIVLVGEFSAGKSTFLNALMGKRLLPSFTSETTATVNFLRHTDRAENGEAGLVHYRDGHTDVLDDVSLETLEGVVTTRGNKDGLGVAEDIDHVDVFLNSRFLQDGVMLVDSPGLNGIAEHHRQITEKQILASHASIFMFSADHPGSQTDFSILKELKEFSPRLFIVLNKIDTIKVAENETPEGIVAHLKESYRTQFPDEESVLPEIWPVSGYQALCARDASVEYRDNPTTESDRRRLEQDSRMEAFEDRLWKYLTEGEKAREQLSQPIESCIARLQDQQQEINTQLEVLRNAGTETRETLVKEREKLQDRIEELQTSKSKADMVFKKEIRSILVRAQEAAASEAGKVSTLLLTQISNIEDRDGMVEFAETIISRLDKRYARVAAEVESQLSSGIRDAVQDSCDRYFDNLEENFEAVADTGEWHLVLESPKLNLKDAREVGLAAFAKQQQALAADIAKNESEIDRLDEQTTKANAAQRKLTRFERTLEALQERRMAIDMITPPQAYEEIQDVERFEKREGLFGRIGNALFGPRRVVEHKAVLNTDAHDKVQQEKNESMKVIDAEINALRSQINDAEGEVVADSATSIQRKMSRLEQEHAELWERRKQLHQDMIEKLQREEQNQRRRGERALRDFIEETAEEFQNSVKSHLSRQEKRYREVAQELLNETLNQELERQQAKLQELIETMEGTVAEREKREEEAKKALAELEELLGEANELRVRLQHEMSDQIEQVQE